MDASELLRSVAEAYGKLTSLAVEFLITNESEEEGYRTEQRARAHFLAPDKIRIEQGGRSGWVTVINGTDLHQYFGTPKRYSKSTLEQRESMAGWFQPGAPTGGGTVFLFNRIAERVVEAEVLREEQSASGSPCQVLSVRYEPPLYSGFTVSTSPMLFWVDSRTRLVRRIESESAHRLPAHDDTHTTRFGLEFKRVVIDEPIASETFEFSPPADAIDASDPSGRRACVVVTGGGGARQDRGNGTSFEHWHSHDWAGETLIEQSRMKLHGFDLAFERRFTLSDDRKQLRIVERITGPKGQTGREVAIPVA